MAASDGATPDLDAGSGDLGDASETAGADSGSPTDAGAADSGDGEDATRDVATDVADIDAAVDTVADAPSDAATDLADTDVRLDPVACPSRLPPVPGDQLWPDGALSVEVPACAPLALPAAIPAGATWQVRATGLPADARLFAYDATYLLTPDAPPPVRARSEFAGASGDAAMEVASARSGEWWIVIERDDPSTTPLIEVTARCIEGCDRESTRYPIVLVHGYAGVDSYFGVLDYFFDVVPTLEDRGFVAFTPVMDAIADSVDRAAQLAPQIDNILRSTGARRVNLIAHSQGGLDARYLVSSMGYGDRVATITTLATPHGGIPAVLFDFFSVHDFGDAATALFNATNPDDPRVGYYSWTFRSCQALQLGCVTSSNGEIVDAFLLATHTLLSRFGDNDGIVPTASMAWGEVLGLRYADHFDQVGQIADLDLPIDPFDHRTFYRDEARRLAASGY